MLDGITGKKLEKKTENHGRCNLPHIFLEETTDMLFLHFV